MRYPNVPPVSGASTAMYQATRPPRAHSRFAEILCVILFVGIMAASNLAIAHFGPWFLPVTAFVGVGISLVSRDYLHDVWHDYRWGFWPRMLGMVAAAAALSFAVDQSALMIAIASVSALTSAALAETVVFQALFKTRWMIRSNGSSLVGALADSIVFPLVAFGYGGVEGFWLLVATQAATKMAGAFVWTTIFRFTINPDKKRAARAARRAEIAAREQAVADANKEPVK